MSGSQASHSSSDSVVLVWGASGGIGRATVQRLAARGQPVLALGRDLARLSAMADIAGVDIAVSNPCERESVDQVVSEALAAGRMITGLINCVGSLLLKPAHLTSTAEFRETLETHLVSAFHVVQAAGKHLRHGASVVLLSSAAARIGFANHEAIAAAKAGVLGLVLSAAATYGSKGLRFNAVAPGLVQTPLTERIWSNPASEAISAQMHVLGRLGQPAEVASLIDWLVHPDQAWVTGQIFGIDGGLGVTVPRPRA